MPLLMWRGKDFDCLESFRNPSGRWIQPLDLIFGVTLSFFRLESRGTCCLFHVESQVLLMTVTGWLSAVGWNKEANIWCRFWSWKQGLIVDGNDWPVLNSGRFLTMSTWRIYFSHADHVAWTGIAVGRCWINLYACARRLEYVWNRIFCHGFNVKEDVNSHLLMSGVVEKISNDSEHLQAADEQPVAISSSKG